MFEHAMIMSAIMSKGTWVYHEPGPCHAIHCRIQLLPCGLKHPGDINLLHIERTHCRWTREIQARSHSRIRRPQASSVSGQVAQKSTLEEAYAPEPEKPLDAQGHRQRKRLMRVTQDGHCPSSVQNPWMVSSHKQHTTGYEVSIPSA